LFNWTPGTLKNYLLQLKTALVINKDVDCRNSFAQDASLAQLKTERLYIPKNDFRETGSFVGDGKYNDSTKIMKGYKFDYKVISNDELDQKILTDPNPFFYLLFMTTGSCKMVAVVDSQTGELMYSKFTTSSYNLKEGDLERLSKEINK
jgi:hypothetical protein